MKKFYIQIIAFSLPSICIAGSDTTDMVEMEYTGEDHSQEKIWTMEECMEYSAENSLAVTKARWDLANSEVNNTEAFANFFPSLSAQIGGQLNWGRNIDPETNTYNNIATFNNGYGVYLSMTVFDGGRTFNSYKLARAERKKSINSIQMQKDDRAIATMMAYVDALYYKGAVKIAVDKLSQSKEVLEQTKLMEELGIKSFPDVAEAEATVAGDEYSLVQQRNLYLQSMLKLRSTMNLPEEEGLTLNQETGAFVSPAVTDDSGDIIAKAVIFNPEAIDAEMEVRLRRYRLLQAKGRLFPEISLNAGISTSYFKNLTGDYSIRFSDQFRNNRGEYLAVTLSLPLFSNLSIISGVKRMKNDLSRSIVEKEERLRQLHDNIILAVADRNGYAQEILSMKAKTEADKKAYELNGRKYEEGLLSLIDLRLSANTYYSSQLSLLQKRMLYILKDKLVDYYRGNQSWMSK